MNQQVENEERAYSAPPRTKWGAAVSSGRNGFQVLPDSLLRNQKRLGLTCTDMVVLVNVLMHWWESDPDNMPHPRPNLIAKRIGTSQRTVQRSIARLCRRGLLKPLPSKRGSEGLAVRRFDVRGLVEVLRKLASEQLKEESAV